MYIPHDTTYNDLIKEFSQEYRVRRDEILKELKQSFKPYTGLTVNSLVSLDTYQTVLDSFDHKGYDKGCFASWLSRYKWKTPLQAECGDEGYTFAEWLDHSKQQDALNEYHDSDVAEEIDLSLQILEELKDNYSVTLYSNDPENVERWVTFYSTTSRYSMRVNSEDVYRLTEESQNRHIKHYCSLGYTLKDAFDDVQEEIPVKPVVEPLKVIDVFVEAFGESQEAWAKMKSFIQFQGGSKVYHPWTVLEAFDVLALKKWLGAYYPSFGLCGSKDERFKPSYLQT